MFLRTKLDEPSLFVRYLIGVSSSLVRKNIGGLTEVNMNDNEKERMVQDCHIKMFEFLTLKKGTL